MPWWVFNAALAWRLFESLPDDEKARFLTDLLTKAGKVSIVKTALAWLNGKKTYIVAGLTVMFGILEATGHPVPYWVYAVLGGLGFTVIRVGVAKSQAAATAVMAAVKTIQPPAEPVNQSTNPPGN